MLSIARTKAALRGNIGFPVCGISCDVWYQAPCTDYQPHWNWGTAPTLRHCLRRWGYLSPYLVRARFNFAPAILFPLSLMTEQIYLKIYSVCAFIFVTLRVLLSVSTVSLLFGFLSFQQNCSSHTELPYLLPIVFASYLVVLVKLVMP